MGANGKIIQFGMVIPVLIAVVLHAAEAHEVAISWWWGGLLWALAFIGFHHASSPISSKTTELARTAQVNA